MELLLQLFIRKVETSLDLLPVQRNFYILFNQRKCTSDTFTPFILGIG